MLIEKRSFFSGQNSDDDPKLLDDKSSLNIMNARMAVSEYGRMGRLENLPGTTLISQSVYPPYGTNQCIGSVVETERNRLIYFICNTFGDHGIYAFDFTTRITYAVIYDSQIEGGLNFSLTSRVSRNAKVISGLLYWTDDLNEPKKLNIDAGIKTNHAGFVTDAAAYAIPMAYTTQTLIKRPPIYPLTVAKVTDNSYDNNFVSEQAVQGTYFYGYRDYEDSALAAYGTLAPYNFPTETSNAIDLSVPFAEYIDDDVQLVNLCVKLGNDGNTEIVKIFDKANADDAAAILAHNNNVTQLSYRYYADVTGIPLDAVKANAPFHGVPLLSKTMEVVKDRLFLFNNLFGYDTPLTSSLAITLGTTDTGGGGTFTADWKYFDLTAWTGSGGSTVVERYYYAYYSSGAPNTYFYDAEQTSTPPVSIDSDNADIRSYSEEALASYILFNRSPQTPGYVWASFPYNTTSNGSLYFRNANYPGTGATTQLVYVVDIQLTQFFKSSSTYNVSIAFYDRFRRKCGVVDLDNKITIPERTLNQVSFATIINWTLSNTDAISEIPDWAYYYQIHITKSLVTRFFVQGLTVGAAYITKNADTGELDFTGTSFDQDTTYALGLNLSTLAALGLGYTFAEGDLARVYMINGSTGYNFKAKIIGQEGNYVLLSPIDIGTITVATEQLLYELYTPYFPSVQEPFYETGDVMDITEPGTDSRMYSVTSGSINGDCYAIQRQLADSTIYIVEAMSPNDLVWQYWQTDRGWVNYIDKIGQVDLTNTITWSDTLIPGSKTNALNVYQPLNRRAIPLECGEGQKLQITSKVQDEQGIVMLAICTNETASLYMGETQQYGSNQQTTLTVSTEVIGTINILKGSRGTQNPESVISYQGIVQWYDILNGAIVQYSQSGLTDVSRYKQTRFFQNYAKGYKSASTGNLDNINGFHHIPSAIDPFYKEFLFTLPALIYENYANTLPSYTSVPSYATSIIDRFDIWDELGKTMAFQYEENKWGSNYEFMGEWYDSIQNILVGFKEGRLYIHNDDSANWNKFYGTQYPVRVCTTANLNGSILKDLFNIGVEANAIPDYVVAMANYPNEQITDLASTDDVWANDEGVFYAPFLADRLSPNSSGTADEKLFTGDNLKDFAIFVMCEWSQVYEGLFYCNYLNIGWDMSKGQSNIVNVINK